MNRNLHIVRNERETSPPDTSYEHRERQRIASKDWAAVHVRGDRSAPLDFFLRPSRGWLR
jgi:hypothetical protein